MLDMGCLETKMKYKIKENLCINLKMTGQKLPVQLYKLNLTDTETVAMHDLVA